MDTNDDAKDKNTTGGKDGDNTVKVRKKTTVFESVTNKDTITKDAAARTGNNAKNIEKRQNKDSKPEKKKRKCKCLATVKKA